MVSKSFYSFWIFAKIIEIIYNYNLKISVFTTSDKLRHKSYIQVCNEEFRHSICNICRMLNNLYLHQLYCTTFCIYIVITCLLHNLDFEKSKSHKKLYSECLLSPVVLRDLCCSMCLILYWPFCHGALKLEMSTLFTTFLLWTSLQCIFCFRYWFSKQCVFYSPLYNGALKSGA